jgi:hypothetical protein
MLVLLVSIVIAVIAYFLLTQIDLIVHGQLYGFGLIFSPEWANSYWVILRSVYACLVTLVVLNSIAFLSGVVRKKQKLARSGRQGFSERALARARDFEERVRETLEVEMLSENDAGDLVENLEVGVEQEKEFQVAAKSLESED